jgi:hypothetical protein
MSDKKLTRAEDFLRDVVKWGSPVEGFALLRSKWQYDHMGVQNAPLDGGQSISYIAYKDGSHLCLRGEHLYAAKDFSDIESAYLQSLTKVEEPLVVQLEFDSMRRVVTESLVLAGWTAFDGPALATKKFDTAVGEKEAVAWLQDWGSDSGNYTLHGDYQSEGRNALEAGSVLIPKDASSDEVRSAVSRFASDADEAVANTYAARLHRPGQ